MMLFRELINQFLQKFTLTGRLIICIKTHACQSRREFITKTFRGIRIEFEYALPTSSFRCGT